MRPEALVTMISLKGAPGGNGCLMVHFGFSVFSTVWHVADMLLGAALVL